MGPELAARRAGLDDAERVTEIKQALMEALHRGGHQALDELVGVDAATMTAQPWPQ